MSEGRLSLGMNIKDIIITMSDGDSAALNVLLELITKSESIDPDSLLPGVSAIMELDFCGIYGPRIWYLFKNVAGMSMRKTIGLLRATQFGFLGRKDLDFAIDNHDEDVDVDGLMTMVQERLPNFAKEE